MKTYLGIDIGSLSTNLVLLDEQKQVLIKKYLPTAGRPIEAVKRGLKEIRQEIKDEIEVLGVGTTGSGRYMIADLVGADIVKNEITAQANGAVNADPAVDTVFEIGGQDSKYISLENGVVIDFTMNKVCAAGTGSFLEEQAEKLGIDIKEEFSSLALRSKSPAPLGDRCTVFIESELNKYLQKGANKEDLTAGLARAIVKNYLNKVVETRRIGKKILFQGGVAFNKSVVKAFEEITDKKIIVPSHHEVTGAIGIALIAIKEKSWDKSKFKGFNISELNYQIESFECKSCSNICEINKVVVENESPIYYGGRCEKWEKGKNKPANPSTSSGQAHQPGNPLTRNLFKERDEIIFSQVSNKGTKKIGIPRVLFFFERFPFWQAFFNKLGFEVVLSSPSNQRIIQNSFENTPVEACFPIMLAHGHILDLLDKKIDYLFIPSLINMEKASEKFNESFNCPFIQALPYFAKAGIKFDKHLKILSPNLEPQRGSNHFKKQLLKLGKQLGASREKIQSAIAKAEKSQNSAKDQLIKRGQEVLKQIEAEKIPALAIISRPYNGSDPMLNLNIPKKLKDMEVLAIPMDYLPASRASIADEYPNMYWNYGQKMLAAAKFVNQHPSLSAVHISNFRCGPDSFISHQLKEIINSKPFLQIEVDEHASDTGVITRLEAFLDSAKNIASKAPRLKKAQRRQNTKKQRTLFISRMSDHALALSAAIRACGVDSEVLPPSDERTLELGRKHTSGKECHPFIVTTGDFIRKIMEPGLDRDRTAFFMPSASGPCRFGHYNHTHRIILDRLGFHDVP
ncbi:MAG: CoA activase, partial [Candidatus Margulisbacteria bacterium]|nr:CoA activase [Candidatus Margulisiibacteriota bacterium]